MESSLEGPEENGEGRAMNLWAQGKSKVLLLEGMRAVGHIESVSEGISSLNHDRNWGDSHALKFIMHSVLSSIRY